MSFVAIDTNQLVDKDPNELTKIIREKGIKRGDKVAFTFEEQEPNTVVLIIVLVALSYAMKSEQLEEDEFSREALKKAFQGIPLEEMEAEIENELGIYIEIKSRKDVLKEKMDLMLAKQQKIKSHKGNLKDLENELGIEFINPL